MKYRLINTPIKMQAKFTNVSTLEPFTAKLQLNGSYAANERFPLLVKAPASFRFEDVSQAPIFECKVMIRAGASAGDEATETLIVRRIERKVIAATNALKIVGIPLSE